MTPKSVAQANIAFNDSGTPYSVEFDDVYFSNDNGLKESRYVFVDGNNLTNHWSQKSNIHIAETGFGTGLNFFATWLKLNEALKLSQQDLSFTFTSFEKFPLNKNDLTAALQCWPQIANQAQDLLQAYPDVVEQDLCLEFNNDDTDSTQTKQNNIKLNILIGDVNERIADLISDTPNVDAWYLDGFAPSKNPDMWRQSLFDQMAKTCTPQASLATFTAAGFVRRGLIDAGFDMQKRKGFGHKREMLIGQFTP